MIVPAASAPGDDKRVARYVRRTVYPYSAYYQAILRGERIRGAADVARIPPTELSEVGDPGTLVLRPDLPSILRDGHRWLAARAATAKVVGGMDRFNRRVVEDGFKPIHWVVGAGVPLGYSAVDLQRLASLGQQWLERAGVGRGDVVLSLLPPGPSVAHWQLVLGCRRARTSAMHLDPTLDAEWAERLAPSVLAGAPDELLALLHRARGAGHALANLRTLLAVGEPLSADLRAQLRAAAPGAVVVAAWAPPGVRALWSECRVAAERAAVTGYHAWDDDVLEVGPDNELLWTGVRWRGSAVVRLRTHVPVTIDRTPCGACGRGHARIIPAPTAPANPPTVVAPDAPESYSPAVVLDAEPDVAVWHLEHRTVAGARETIVTLAPTWGAAVGPMIRRLDRRLQATQFIVLPNEEVVARIEAAGGRRVLDDTA